jgi:sugar lactone lactonase YvrE
MTARRARREPPPRPKETAREELMKFARFAGSAVAALLLAAPALAEPEWRVLAQFDDAPEGLVVDGKGGLFTTMFGTARVMHVAADGTRKQVADLKPALGGAQGSTIGMDYDGKDTIYVAFAGHSDRYPWPMDLAVAKEACGDNTVKASGLYKVTVSTGAVEAIATRADGYPFCYPDDPAIGPDGKVYVSDLSFSGIWRVDPADKSAVMWSKDRLMDPGPAPLSGFPVGVNGIAIAPDGSAVYGVTGGNPMIFRIPINADGTAGAGSRVAFGYDNMDGLEIDEDGNFYITEATRHEVWKVSPDTTKRQQLGNPLDAPLGSPASIAFLGDEVCVTNLNFFQNLPKEKANTIVCASKIDKKW